MCGILALAGPGFPSFSHRLLEGLRRRGPDQQGFWTDGHLHLGQTRLAVVGLDQRTAGPRENETHVLAHNGEIYNFTEIARPPAGQRWATDTEALLAGWSREGPRLLPRLRGFWAFVAYEKAARKLVLVRDGFGVKPLYYWLSPRGFAASSLLSSLLQVVEERPDLDWRALSEYARYQFTFGNRTFLRQVRKVEPGTLVEYDLATGDLSVRRYEDPFASPPAEADGPWLAETRRVLVDSVREATVSDVPLTCALSGGLDSTLVTRLVQPPVAYHCRYRDPECDELPFARAAVAGTRVELQVVEAEEDFDLVARLRGLLEDLDELSIGAAILPLDDLFAQVRKRHRVVLTGTGGDELFAGYVRYLLAMGVCPQDSYLPLHRRLSSLRTPAERFERAHTKGDVGLYRFADAAAECTFREALATCGVEEDPLSAMVHFDRRHFLPGLLNLEDKLSGRHSLEARPVLLHQVLVRQVCGQRPSALMRGSLLKGTLRELGAGLLPEVVRQRPDKMGFTTPVGTFVDRSADRIREQLSGSRFRDLYELRAVNFTATGKFSRELFGLLLLDLWLERFQGTPPRGPSAWA